MKYLFKILDRYDTLKRHYDTKAWNVAFGLPLVAPIQLSFI